MQGKIQTFVSFRGKIGSPVSKSPNSQHRKDKSHENFSLFTMILPLSFQLRVKKWPIILSNDFSSIKTFREINPSPALWCSMLDCCKNLSCSYTHLTSNHTGTSSTTDGTTFRSNDMEPTYFRDKRGKSSRRMCAGTWRVAVGASGRQKRRKVLSSST